MTQHSNLNDPQTPPPRQLVGPPAAASTIRSNAQEVRQRAATCSRVESSTCRAESPEEQGKRPRRRAETRSVCADFRGGGAALLAKSAPGVSSGGSRPREVERSNADHGRLVRLWKACAEGEDSSWESFVEVVHPRLLRIARHCSRRYLGTHRECDAFDFVQEVYCKLLADRRSVMRRAEFTVDEQIRAMLRTTLTRIVIDERRRSRGRGRVRQCSLGPVPPSEVRERRTPEVEVLAREALREFVRGCNSVADATRAPARNRRILRMAWLEGRNAGEVSRREDLSANGVHALMFRARGELARRHGWHVTTFYGGT